MKARIIKFRFKSPIHLGNREGVLESALDYIPSDLLFSAFCNAYRMLYGSADLEKMIEEQNNKPSIRFSSGFPYYRDIYFLPRPLNLDLGNFGLDPKKAKRVRFVDFKVFKSFVTNTLYAEDLQNYLGEPVDGALIPLSYKGAHIRVAHEVPRVALDSITAASNIYYFHQMSFAAEAGIFSLFQCREEERNRIETCFRLLGDEGIGGDRSSGKGLFEVEYPGDMEFPTIEKPSSYVLLSLFYPQKEETMQFDGDYNLIKRSGYVYSFDETSRRRQTVRMMTDGSVVYSHHPPMGSLIDLTPPGFEKHRVWRNGLGFSVASVMGKGGQRI